MSESKEKKATKAKKSSSTPVVVVKTYEERCEAVNIIAQPLASKKTTKKAYKLVKKAASALVSSDENKTDQEVDNNLLYTRL
mmetsp:Transcript_6185/g.8911  ORF Transcript_6185/g.8911 Transcript_6185/m.8911 type:complete len:82 (+) Transcript_6185:410-655(+)